MTDKDFSNTVKELLTQPNQCTAQEKILLLQKLIKFLSLSDIKGSETKYYDVLKIYIQCQHPDIKKVALDLLVACLKLGLFKQLPNNLTLNIAYSVIYVSTQENETVEYQEIWLKAFTALEYMDDLYVDICRTRGSHMIGILNNALKFNITTSMHKLKALQIFDLLIGAIDVAAVMDSIFSTWRQQIWPLAHNLKNSNLQIAAYDVSMHLLPNLKTYLQDNPNNWDVILADIQYKYLPIVQLILSDENVLYGKLWIFMVKLMGSKFHKGSTIVNSMLLCMENAFRNQEPEIRKHAFLCWQVLIDSYSHEATEINTSKRLKLFSMPLKINNARTEELVNIKFETWCKLLNLLQIKNFCCAQGILDLFLNFCFGSLCDTPLIYYRDNAVGLLSQGKRFSSMHLKTCKALLQLIGNRKYINNELRSKLTYFNFEEINFSEQQFVDNSRNIIYSVGEGCVMLGLLPSKDRAELSAINEALWKSLFLLIDSVTIEANKIKVIQELSTLILALIGVAKRKPAIISFGVEPLFNMITSEDFEVFKHEKISENLFIPMLAVVMKKDKIFLQYDIVPIIQKVFVFKRKYANYPEFVHNSISLLLRRSVYKETLDTMLKIWFMFEEELNYHISHTPKENFKSSLYTNIFFDFFFLPLPHLCLMSNTKNVCTKWKELYDLVGQSKIVLHYRMLNNLSHLLMQNIKVLISEKPHDVALAEIAYVIVKNLRLEECDQGSCSDVEGVCNELKSVVSMTNLTPEVVNLYESCVRHLLENSSKLSYLYHVLDAISGCVGSLLTVYNKTDILPPALKFVENIDSNNIQVKTGIENLIDKLCEYQQLKGIQKITDPEPEPQIEQSDSQKAFEKTDQEQVMVLLGHDVKMSTPVKLKGSFLNNIKAVTPETVTSTTGKVKDLEANEFVVINSPYRFDRNKLTKHQKEQFSRRRDDIPALYQDLSQSQNTFNEISQDLLQPTVELETIQPLLAETVEEPLLAETVEAVEQPKPDDTRMTRNTKKPLPEDKRQCIITRRKSVSRDTQDAEIFPLNNNSCSKEPPKSEPSRVTTRKSKNVHSDTEAEVSEVQKPKRSRMPLRRKSMGSELPPPDLEIITSEEKRTPRRRRSALFDRPPELEIIPILNNNVSAKSDPIVENLEMIGKHSKTEKTTKKSATKKNCDNIDSEKVAESTGESMENETEKADVYERRTKRFIEHLNDIITDVVKYEGKTEEPSEESAKTLNAVVSKTRRSTKRSQLQTENADNLNDSSSRKKPGSTPKIKKTTLLDYKFELTKELDDVSTPSTSSFEESVDNNEDLAQLKLEAEIELEKLENVPLTERKLISKTARGRRRRTTGFFKNVTPPKSATIDEKKVEPAIKKEKMIESELRRLTMDINDRQDYIKTDKRKTRLCNFQSWLESPESPKVLRSSRSPTNTSRSASEKRLKKRKFNFSAIKTETAPAIARSESESIIESSQEEPEINVKPCKVPGLYPIEKLKPGDELVINTGNDTVDIVKKLKPDDELIINTGNDTVDIVKQPEKCSPFKLIIKQPTNDVNILTDKKVTCTDPLFPKEAIEDHSYSIASKGLSEDDILAPEFIAIKAEDIDKPMDKEISIITDDVITSSADEPDLVETESISVLEKDPLSDDQMVDEGLCKNRKVLFNESILSDELDKTEPVCIPIPNKLLDKIPTSPTSTDTPTRNKELLRDTCEISPIRNASRLESNDKIVEVTETVDTKIKTGEQVRVSSPEMFESQQIVSIASGSGTQKTEGEKLSGNASNYSKLQIRKRGSRNLFGRSAQMMNLMSLKAALPPSPVKKTKNVQVVKSETNTFTPPTQGRISKMLKHLEKMDSKETPEQTSDVVEVDLITPKKTDLEAIKDEDLLTFIKILPSPFDTPDKSILKKRKLPEDEEEATPQASKKRRVNFHDPPVSCTKFYEKISLAKLDPALKAEIMSKEFMDVQTGVENAEIVDDDASESNQTYDNKTSICEALVTCMDSVKALVPKLTTLDFSEPVLSVLKSRHIMSVGDLAKLTELQVFEIPLKVEVVRSALTDYHESLSKETPTRQRRKIKPVILYSPINNIDSIKTRSTPTSSEVSVITTVKSKEIPKDSSELEANHSLPLFSEDNTEIPVTNEEIIENSTEVEDPVNDQYETQEEATSEITTAIITGLVNDKNTEVLIVNNNEVTKLDDQSSEQLDLNSEEIENDTNFSQDTVILDVESTMEDKVLQCKSQIEKLPKEAFTVPALRKHLLGAFVEKAGVSSIVEDLSSSMESTDLTDLVYSHSVRDPVKFLDYVHSHVPLEKCLPSLSKLADSNATNGDYSQSVVEVINKLAVTKKDEEAVVNSILKKWSVVDVFSLFTENIGPMLNRVMSAYDALQPTTDNNGTL